MREPVDETSPDRVNSIGNLSVPPFIVAIAVCAEFRTQRSLHLSEFLIEYDCSAVRLAETLTLAGAPASACALLFMNTRMFAFLYLAGFLALCLCEVDDIREDIHQTSR